MTRTLATGMLRSLWFLSLVAASVGMIVDPAYGDVVAGDGGGTVSVGVSTGTSTPGSGGAPTSGTGTSGSAACTYVLLPPSDQTLLGIGGQLPGSWYLRECPNSSADSIGSVVVWFPDQGPPSAPAPTAPEGVAEQAERSMVLPVPQPGVNPSPRAVVNLPEWLWIDPSIWHPVSVTDSAGGVSATATAVPVSVTWTMGDGGDLVCDGPGTPYVVQLPAATQTTACSYTYRASSASQPSPDGDPNDAAYEVTATVTWNVTWHAVGTEGGGSLPGLTTSVRFALAVQQIESVNVQ